MPIERTVEQQHIASFALPPALHGKFGSATVVTAGAGAGKTTTLVMIKDDLVDKHGHREENIWYASFNKENAREMQEKMPVCKCTTIHSMALSSNAFLTKARSQIVEEKYALDFLHKAAANKIVECGVDFSFAGADARAQQRVQKSLAAKMARFALASLQVFLQSDANEAVGLDNTLESNTVEAAHKWHADHNNDGPPAELGNLAAKGWYVEAAQAFWRVLTGVGGRVGAKTVALLDAVVKRALLYEMPVHKYATALLVDESQDLTRAMAAWICMQVKFGVHVFLVGDPAQSIYGFRGADANYVQQFVFPEGVIVNRCSLSVSYRFGPDLAAVANTVCFAKSHSPQGQDGPGDSFRLVGGSSEPTVVTTKSLLIPEEWNKEPVVFIARSNATLITTAINLLVEHKDAPPRMKMIGEGEHAGKNKFRKTFTHLHSFYEVYMASVAETPRQVFLRHPEFTECGRVSWQMVCEHVEQADLVELKTTIMLVNTFGAQTTEYAALFEDACLDDRNDDAEPQVIFVTGHGAKGGQWGRVIVANDMISIGSFMVSRSPGGARCGQFNLAERAGDGVNLLYVALTRARKQLSIPSNCASCSALASSTLARPMSST
jgi:superfamily I DNA/RNA helicase